MPGAVGWNWTTQLCDTVVRDVIPKKKLEELLGDSGIANDSTVSCTATTTTGLPPGRSGS